jgi:hypothetical protein
MKTLQVTIILTATLISSTRLLAQEANTSSASAFERAVAEYGKAPSSELAVKVIKAAAELDELPPVPEEARKHFIRGSVLFKDAKTADDFSKSAAEFSQAIQISPLLAEAHYNLAMVNEASADYVSAVYRLKVYQLFKLSPEEARRVQDKIYALELKSEQRTQKIAEEQRASQLSAIAEQQRSESARAAAISRAEQERKQYYENLGFLEGKWHYQRRGVSKKSGKVYDDYGEAMLRIEGDQVKHHIVPAVTSGMGWVNDNGFARIKGKDYTSLVEVYDGGPVEINESRSRILVKWSDYSFTYQIEFSR